jgi:hypothetical protein
MKEKLLLPLQQRSAPLLQQSNNPKLCSKREPVTQRKTLNKIYQTT